VPHGSGTMSRYLHQLSVRRAAAQPRHPSLLPRQVPSAALAVLPGQTGGGAVTALKHPVRVSVAGDEALAHRNIDEGWSKQCLAMLPWSALMATTVVFASLLQAFATVVLVVPERAALPVPHLYETTAPLENED
jgi:hypothetical protein